MKSDTSLSRFERSWLRLFRTHGRLSVVVTVTAVAVTLSLGFTFMMASLSDATSAELGQAMIRATLIPMIIAPAIAMSLTRVFEALDTTSGELQHVVRNDLLTGLLNRRTFTDEAARYLARPLVSAMVATVDIDDFKAVNDRYGHATGDRALETLASRLANAFGANAIVGRLGGDEFAIVVPVDARHLADSVNALLDACDLGDMLPGLRASSWLHDDHGTDPTQRRTHSGRQTTSSRKGNGSS